MHFFSLFLVISAVFANTLQNGKNNGAKAPRWTKKKKVAKSRRPGNGSVHRVHSLNADSAGEEEENGTRRVNLPFCRRTFLNK